jgi:hypothetical protein
MTFPRLTISDRAYNLAWANRKSGESIPQLITRVIIERFEPKRPATEKPLLTWVEVRE